LSVGYQEARNLFEEWLEGEAIPISEVLA